MLFAKRELLTKRNSVLEEQVVKLAKTIEAADPADAAAPELQKDISEVSDRELANPEKESVLDGYQVKLEQQNLPTIDFGSTDKRIQLRNFYAIGPDGLPVLDPLDQKPATKGPGSMQELLDQLFDRAKAQQAALNKTRAELTKMRDLLTTSVNDVNKLKTDGRTTKKELKDSREQVASLTTEKEALESRVAKLTAEKKELSAEVADAKNEVERLNEEKVTITEELATTKKMNEELIKKMKGTSSGTTMGGGDGTVAVNALTAGDKGKIIEANDELKFVIIDFSGDAMIEMLGPERQNALPQLEMNVRRTGRQSAAGDFVTRIKLRQAVRGKNLVVADILSDWQQATVEKGDVVFF
jgi:archaellum component FlaC